MADQGEVWHDVAAQLQELQVASATHALSDAYEGHRAAVRVRRALPARGRQVGGVYALAGDVIGLECFDTPAAFAAAAPKLVQSYAMDLLAREPSDDSAAVDAARALLDEVRRAPATAHPATGLGRHLRIGTDALVGGALALDDVVIHLFAFRRQSEPTPRPRRLT